VKYEYENEYEYEYEQIKTIQHNLFIRKSIRNVTLKNVVLFSVTTIFEK
jgi:hypothetical protein